MNPFEGMPLSAFPTIDRGIPRIELGTSRTRSEHYATKPNPLLVRNAKKAVYNTCHKIAGLFCVLKPRQISATAQQRCIIIFRPKIPLFLF